MVWSQKTNPTIFNFSKKKKKKGHTEHVFPNVFFCSVWAKNNNITKLYLACVCKLADKHNWRWRPLRGMCAAVFSVNTTCGNLFWLVLTFGLSRGTWTWCQGGDYEIIQNEGSVLLSVCVFVLSVDCLSIFTTDTFRSDLKSWARHSSPI